MHTEQFAKHHHFAVQWHTVQGQLGQPFHGFEFGLPPLGVPWMLRRIGGDTVQVQYTDFVDLEPNAVIDSSAAIYKAKISGGDVLIPE